MGPERPARIASTDSQIVEQVIAHAIEDLKGARDKGIVIAGPRQPAEVHLLAYAINEALGNLGATIKLTPEAQVQSHVQAMGELAASIRDGKVSTLPDAAVVFDKPHKNWPAAKWYDLTYRSADGKTVSGVAVMDHPSNPKTTWFNHRGLHMVNPCIVADGPVTIKENLVLKYRLVIHDGDAASVPLAKLYEQFANQK